MTTTQTTAGRVALGGALAAAAIGAIVLMGWFAGSDSIIRVAPTFVAMHPMTAVAFVLAGGSLATFLTAPPGGGGARHRIAARTAALAVVVIGLLRTSGLFGGWDAHMNSWLFASDAPVPIAATTALNLVLMGAALLFVDAGDRRARLAVEWAAVAVGLTSIFAILAYAYGVQSYYHLGPFTPMALHTGLALALLAGAVLFSHTDRGLLEVFAGTSAGGLVARRLLPPAILIPAALGGLARLLQVWGVLHADVSDALAALASVAVFVLLVSWSAKELSGADVARTSAENLFAQMFEHAPIGVALVDLDGRFLRVNQALCRLVGYSEAELMSRTFGDITVQDESQLRADQISAQRMLSGDVHAYQTEKQYVHKSGRLLTILLSTSLIRDARGQPRHFITQVQDITARADAEDALRESDEKFQQLASHITDVFWIRSPDMREVQYVSPAFAKIWGRPVESLYTHPHMWSDFIVPEDRARVQTAFAALTRDDGSVDVEYRITRPDGEIRWVHVRGFQVRGASRELVRHVGIVTDITEQKRSDRAREASEERFRNFFELGLIGMAITSPDKGCLAVNDRLCEILGYERSELLQTPWTAFTHPDDLADETRRYEAMLAGSSDGYSMDKRYIRKDGQQIYATISVKCVRRADRSIDYLLALAQDVTDRKQLEFQLFQSQKLETAGRLAGGIAHEFNSVLTSIIGHGEALANAFPGDSPLQRHAREIRQAADRAATLTRQLLAYGRRQLLRPERLNLNAVMARLDASLRHVAGRATDVRVIAAPGLAAVKADEGQIEQVVMNLAMNAADAMPHGGSLTLQTSNIIIDEEHAVPDLRAGAYVALDIIDTGVGMNQSVKSHLFEPFFTTKPVGQGTGLGLSTCYGIIRQSGGHISVESEPGKGTAFRVFLPQAAATDEPPVERLDSPEMPRGTETILLVEADAALRDVAATLLRRLGYRVQTAGSDAEAGSVTRYAGAERIDLLFREGVRSFSPAALARRIRTLLDAPTSL